MTTKKRRKKVPKKKLEVDLSRVIFLEGQVTLEMMEKIRKRMVALRKKGSPDIEVVITTNGGRGDAAVMIYDLFRTYPGKVIGRVECYARSAGAIILQGCDERQCLKHALIKIHNSLIDFPFISLDILKDAEKLKKLVDAMEARQRKIISIFRQSTGKTSKEIKSLLAKNRDLQAEDALIFGLVDTIF